MIKKMITILVLMTLIIASLTVPGLASSADNVDNENSGIGADMVGGENLDINAPSAILMDADTGTILYSKNANKEMAPASVTKIMTLLLVAEAIEDDRISLDDKVTISENAASMGGSQIFTEAGEEFTVEELLKSAIIASANDAAVALAELVGGSESNFVSLMNKRAEDLKMENTTFENATGLDDTVEKHLTSSYDIALMSRELIKYPIILKYSNVWQDSIRNGEFILTNTNRLVRYYSGCTGLKTGSTDKAGFCISATAKRNGMHLIAVIMGAQTRDERNNAARTLLDYGFATYGVYIDDACALEEVDVLKSRTTSTMVYSKGFTILLNKKDVNKVEKHYNIPEKITASNKAESVVGDITYTLNGEEIGRCEIYIKEELKAISIIEVFWVLLTNIFSCK